VVGKLPLKSKSPQGERGKRKRLRQRKEKQVKVCGKEKYPYFSAKADASGGADRLPPTGGCHWGKKKKKKRKIQKPNLLPARASSEAQND